MSGFTKLHSSLLTSTIWGESPITCKVWITMLAAATVDGIVEATVPGLARLANLSVPEVESALQILSSPDAYSRTSDRDGRRIEMVVGGFRLINYDKYRELMSYDDLRTKAALRQQRYRDRKKVNDRNESSRNVTRDQKLRLSRQAEAEAEAIIQPDSDFDGAEWALKTFKAYPTWGDPDATVVPARLGEIYTKTIDSEAPSHGGLLKAAGWFFEVTQEAARQAAGKDPKFVMSLEKFLRQGYAEVKMPSRTMPRRYTPAESDEDCEKRLRAEARQRRSVAQEAIAG